MYPAHLDKQSLFLDTVSSPFSLFITFISQMPTMWKHCSLLHSFCPHTTQTHFSLLLMWDMGNIRISKLWQNENLIVRGQIHQWEELNQLQNYLVLNFQFPKIHAWLKGISTHINLATLHEIEEKHFGGIHKCALEQLSSFHNHSFTTWISSWHKFLKVLNNMLLDLIFVWMLAFVVNCHFSKFMLKSLKGRRR